MKENFNTKYLDIYLENLLPELSKGTIKNKRFYIGLFLDYLQKHNINDFTNFDINIVYDFVNSLPYASQTISLVKFILREFFDILYKRNLIDFDGRKIFPVIFTNKRDRLISFYSTEEVKELISVLDSSWSNYVMYKCMVLLAAQMGLRSSDILHLKFNEIIWDKDLIQKRQKKTGVFVSVPLPKNIKLLLIDYIKNHRPDCPLEYVFINKQSMNIYCDSEINALMKRLFKKASIKANNRRTGPHALRHSLASRLLKNNTPMPVITGVLGHKNINTTRTYLNIDVESLRQMSLEI